MDSVKFKVSNPTSVVLALHFFPPEVKLLDVLTACPVPKVTQRLSLWVTQQWLVAWVGKPVGLE